MFFVEIFNIMKIYGSWGRHAHGVIAAEGRRRRGGAHPVVSSKHEQKKQFY